MSVAMPMAPGLLPFRARQHWSSDVIPSLSTAPKINSARNQWPLEGVTAPPQTKRGLRVRTLRHPVALDSSTTLRCARNDSRRVAASKTERQLTKVLIQKLSTKPDKIKNVRVAVAESSFLESRLVCHLDILGDCNPAVIEGESSGCTLTIRAPAQGAPERPWHLAALPAPNAGRSRAAAIPLRSNA